MIFSRGPHPQAHFSALEKDRQRQKEQQTNPKTYELGRRQWYAEKIGHAARQIIGKTLGFALQNKLENTVPHQKKRKGSQKSGKKGLTDQRPHGYAFNYPTGSCQANQGNNQGNNKR